MPFPARRDLPNPGVELETPASPALTGGYFYHCTTWEAHIKWNITLQLKENEIMPFVATWMDWGITILSEVIW